MNIPITIDLQNYFELYLHILNPLLKLKKREREVLAAFLKIHYMNRDKSPDRINELLFSKNTKKYIRNYIKMSEPSFNNHIHQLRAKKAIIGDSINPSITKNYPVANKLEINYKLTIN